jgi:predicted DCC family thiol-disulfide oxidoreductase YuxK
MEPECAQKPIRAADTYARRTHRAPMAAGGGCVFYDGHCGPCTFFAKAVQAVALRPLTILPLEDATANPYLGQLPDEVRHSAFHLFDHETLYTGESAIAPLVGAMFGTPWAGLVLRIPPVDRSSRRMYLVFWRYRRKHGCARDLQA